MNTLKNNGMSKITNNRDYGIIRSLLIGFFLLVTMSFVSSCNESTSAPTKNNPSTSTNPTTSDAPAEPVNLGPTGAVDPITNDDVDTSGGVTYYDDYVDPDAGEQLPGTPYENCGVVYRQFNNPTVFYRASNNEVFFLKEFSYDSVPFIRGVRFKDDAFSVCIEGYRDGGDIYLNTFSQKQETNHPLKLYTGQYSNELCGHLAYVTNFSGQTSLNLKIDQYYYLIKKANMSVNYPSGIPSLQVNESITNTNSVEACLYGNKAPYKDYNVTFKSQFEVEAFDLGALNP